MPETKKTEARLKEEKKNADLGKLLVPYDGFYPEPKVRVKQFSDGVVIELRRIDAIDVIKGGGGELVE